jgi:poly(A) polymerase
MSGDPASLLPESVRLNLLTMAGVRPVWLVGGSVRDALAQRPVHDFDFAVQAEALELGRRLARSLGWDYFVLDAERQAGRAIERLPVGGFRTFDISLLRGATLEEDLRLRDFTVNAMAVRLDDPDKLIDPCGGLQDLRIGRLRACGQQAVARDPVRALRGVRLATDLNLEIDPSTLAQMRRAAPALPAVAPERVRDELFAILELERPSIGLRLLDTLQLLGPAFPIAGELERRPSPGTQHSNALLHGLAVVASLEDLLMVLAGEEFNSESAADLILGQASLRLGRFRESLRSHLESRISPGRRRRSLLMLSALLHPLLEKTPISASGRRRRLPEEQVIEQALQGLRLSRQEIKVMVDAMRNLESMTQLDRQRPLGGGAVYRFFRDRPGAGVDSVLLSLADMLGSVVPPVVQSMWESRVETARQLLSARFEGPAELLAPPLLLRGDELAKELNLRHGPLLGRLLEAVREAQADGLANSRVQAIAVARKALADFDLDESAPSG